jgi:hypothetical protein
MRSRLQYAGTVMTVAALVIASAALARPAQAAGSEPTPSRITSSSAKLTFLEVDRVTRRGEMIEIRGRTDPTAEVSVNGQAVPMISKIGAFSYFLRAAARNTIITVTAEASGSLPNTLTLKPDNSQ